MKKQAKFDYDVVLRFYTEDGKYYAEVEKDRTEAHLRNEVIENPSFEDWAEVISDRQDLKAVDVDYNVDTEKAKASHQKASAKKASHKKASKKASKQATSHKEKVNVQSSRKHALRNGIIIIVVIAAIAGYVLYRAKHKEEK